MSIHVVQQVGLHFSHICQGTYLPPILRRLILEVVEKFQSTGKQFDKQYWICVEVEKSALHCKLIIEQATPEMSK